jgi:nitrile hydratase accessory protein
MSALRPSAIAEQLSADLTGPAALPRKNGELVFAEPWESRSFGMAVALCEQGLFSWDEFRKCLTAEIAGHGQECDRNEAYMYYERWLAALERVLLDKGLCVESEIERHIKDEND